MHAKKFIVNENTCPHIKVKWSVPNTVLDSKA